MLKYFVLFAALLLCYSSYELKISFLSEIVRNMKHQIYLFLYASALLVVERGADRSIVLIMCVKRVSFFITNSVCVVLKSAAILIRISLWTHACVSEREIPIFFGNLDASLLCFCGTEIFN